MCQLFSIGDNYQFCNLENVRSVSARSQSARPQFLSLFQKLSSRAISLSLSPVRLALLPAQQQHKQNLSIIYHLMASTIILSSTFVDNLQYVS